MLFNLSAISINDLDLDANRSILWCPEVVAQHIEHGENLIEKEMQHEYSCIEAPLPLGSDEREAFSLDNKRVVLRYTITGRPECVIEDAVVQTKVQDGEVGVRIRFKRL